MKEEENLLALYHDCGKLRENYHDCGNEIEGVDMTADGKTTLHDRLSDSSLDFCERLRLAVNEGELDYWSGRRNPPNLEVDEFRMIVARLRNVSPKWIERESVNGPHGRSGEDTCFKFEYEFKMLGMSRRFFIKGYFFDKGNLKGVTIQSFREVPGPQLKLVP